MTPLEQIRALVPPGLREDLLSAVYWIFVYAVAAASVVCVVGSIVLALYFLGSAVQDFMNRSSN